jgi:hypothetical protein
MNKKVLIIGSVIVAIGAGAYFYFTNKSKKGDMLANNTIPTTSEGNTPTPPSLSTGGIVNSINTQIPPLSVLEVSYTKDDVNLDKAKDIVKSMLKGKNWSEVKQSTIKSINAKLYKIGYIYKNGIITKL